jgi:hypothetical protein
MKLNYQINKKKQSKKKTYVNIPSLWSITRNHDELIERKVKKKHNNYFLINQVFNDKIEKKSILK